MNDPNITSDNQSAGKAGITMIQSTDSIKSAVFEFITGMFFHKLAVLASLLLFIFTFQNNLSQVDKVPPFTRAARGGIFTGGFLVAGQHL